MTTQLTKAISKMPKSNLHSSSWHTVFKPYGMGFMFLFLLGFGARSFGAATTPCEGAQRWTEGGHWNPDGSIVEQGNVPLPRGIVRCGSAADTQSAVEPLYGSIYSPSNFLIDVSTIPCYEPSSATQINVTNPTADQPLIWLNFDVRANAGSFQIQINDNAGDTIGWALFVSIEAQAGVDATNANGETLSGNCSNLTLVACGAESASTWNTLPVPTFSVPANYYLALWDQDADGEVKLNNFKARFGCGDADVLLCNLETGTPTTTCNTNGTYTVSVPIAGINGNYVGTDTNALAPSAPVCLTNPGQNPPVTSGNIVLTYPQSVANYNITIAIDTNGPCADPLFPTNCIATVSGSAPVCCQPPTITCPSNVTVSCESSTDPAQTGSATFTNGCGTVTLGYSDSVAPGSCPQASVITRT